MLAATAFALAGVGPGDWALDNAIDLDLTPMGWGLGALALIYWLQTVRGWVLGTVSYFE